MLRQAMLNNCKDKGRKGLHFSQQKGKIRKNSHVDIIYQAVSGHRRHRRWSRLLMWPGGEVASIKGKQDILK